MIVVISYLAVNPFCVCVQSATLYFSDIADFVDISSDSKPMELVSVLNSIYGLIDEQIGAYDVYKVSRSLYSSCKLCDLFAERHFSTANCFRSLLLLCTAESDDRRKILQRKKTKIM